MKTEYTGLKKLYNIADTYESLDWAGTMQIELSLKSPQSDSLTSIVSLCTL